MTLLPVASSFVFFLKGPPGHEPEEAEGPQPAAGRRGQAAALRRFEAGGQQRRGAEAFLGGTRMAELPKALHEGIDLELQEGALYDFRTIPYLRAFGIPE